MVRNSFHNWEHDHDWHDNIIKVGGHPHVFNARGTHATYIEQGLHTVDYTAMVERWDLWRNLDVIFPWDWNSEKRVIKSDNNLDGVNYLTNVWFWGNAGTGPTIGTERPRVDGPSGWLDKFNDRQAELEKTGFACQGTDTTRCPWPMGIFSHENPLCEPGYVYSYLSQVCQQMQPRKLPECSKSKSFVGEEIEL